MSDRRSLAGKSVRDEPDPREEQPPSRRAPAGLSTPNISRASSLDKARKTSGHPRPIISREDADLLTARIQEFVNKKIASQPKKMIRVATPQPSTSSASMPPPDWYDAQALDAEVDDRLSSIDLGNALNARLKSVLQQQGGQETPSPTPQALRRKRSEEELEENKRQRATTTPEPEGEMEPKPQRVPKLHPRPPATQAVDADRVQTTAGTRVASYATATRAPTPQSSSVSTSAPTNPTSSAANPSATAPVVTAEQKKKRYPPLVVEVLPNWAVHFKQLKQKLGHAPNARPFGKGVRFTPETGDEYRLIQDYLVNLEKTERLVWFSYSLPEERSLKVAIRGLPAETDPTEITEELRTMGFDPETVRNIRARKDRPGCIFFALLKRTPNLTPAIYEVTELLCMPGVKIESWRGKKGPAQCHRCQAFRHSSHNCHRPLACVRCGGPHHAGECPRPKETPATCINCEGAHPANSVSCPVFKAEARNKKAGTVARTTTKGGQRGGREPRVAEPTPTPQPLPQLATVETAPGATLMAPANDHLSSSGKKNKKRNQKKKSKAAAGKQPETRAAVSKPVPRRTTPAEAPQSSAPQTTYTSGTPQVLQAHAKGVPPTTGAQRPPPQIPAQSRQQTHHQQQAPRDAGKLAILEAAIQIMQEILQALRAGEDPIPVVIAGMGKLLQAY